MDTLLGWFKRRAASTNPQRSGKMIRMKPDARLLGTLHLSLFWTVELLMPSALPQSSIRPAQPLAMVRVSAGRGWSVAEGQPQN